MAILQAAQPLTKTKLFIANVLHDDIFEKSYLKFDKKIIRITLDQISTLDPDFSPASSLWLFGIYKQTFLHKATLELGLIF